MRPNRTLLTLFVLSCAPAATLAQTNSRQLPIAEGPFHPTMESLAQYEYPDWFRNAKFGIWSHWGPQAVPMNGDWYARRMYEPGNKHYTYHTNHYGHPSEFGYKDIIPLWKAEKWNPDRLMELYKRAGAKYFVSMASHHDNFFLWNTKLHRWNSVAMGPKRDVVRDWQKAAQRHGLKFGVSEHLGASFTWFQSSHRADRTGPRAGMPYDGANSNYWDLYHFPAESGDRAWYSTNPRWHQRWYTVIQELVDTYHPDLLYTDGGVAFGQNHVVGLSMIAHLYNQDIAHRAASSLDIKGAELLRADKPRMQKAPQVVYTCKQKSGGRWVEDIERGILPRIDPHPWQTDTSIGDWYYNRDWEFRPVSWVIHMLVDNVSKNGNLLLNVVQRPDGSLDTEVERMLEQLAEWNAIHGEAIFGSRPWLVYGESGVRVQGGAFKEDFKYNAREIRFTTRGATLYAIALGWPEDRKITIRSLAKPAGSKINRIERIALLGHDGRLDWAQTSEGLIITLPEKRVSEFTTALRITGSALTNVPFTMPPVLITPDAQGRIALSPESADVVGNVRAEQRRGQPSFGFWDNASDSVSWTVRFPNAGKYNVQTACASARGDIAFVLEVGRQTLNGVASRTASFDDFAEVDLGILTVEEPGDVLVRGRPKEPAQWQPINLRTITLTPQ
jgi:alpha-L-fucosidase